MTAPPAIPCTLTPSEFMIAASVGLRRQFYSVLSGKKDSFGFDGDGWGIHIEGAAGELAASKVTGRRWLMSVNAYGDTDDIEGCQVKTRSLHHYDLIIRPKVAPDRVMIHVTGKAPHLVVRGWIIAQDGRRPEFLQYHGGRPGAHFVPASALHAMDTLPALDPDEVPEFTKDYFDKAAVYDGDKLIRARKP